MAALALDPARQHCPGGVDVGHDVDSPLALPQLVGSVRTAAGGDARVREPGVDRSHLLLNLADQRVGGLLVGYVESPRSHGRAELFAYHLVEVCGHHVARSALQQPPHQRTADATSRASDHGNSALGVHRGSLRARLELRQHRFCHPAVELQVLLPVGPHLDDRRLLVPERARDLLPERRRALRPLVVAAVQLRSL